MDVLTRERAKPALPYGGVHRLIDFALSGLVHADLADVWVSLEYQVTSIDDYLSGGRPWSLDRNRGGFRRIVPQTGTGPATESGFAHGNGDLLLRMSADLEAFGARTLVVCSADHVFNMDLAPVIEEHVAAGRVATVLTSEVTKKDASDNVVVLAGRDGTITGVEHKPSRPSCGHGRDRDLPLRHRGPAGDAARPPARAGGEAGRRRQRHRRLRRAPPAAPRRDRQGRRGPADRLLARRRPAEPLPAVPPRPARRPGRRLRPPGPAGHLALARPSRRPRPGDGRVPRLAAVAGLRTSPASSWAACWVPASWWRRARRSTTAW